MCHKKLVLALMLLAGGGSVFAQAGTRVTLDEVLRAESEITRNQLEAKKIESLGDAAIAKNAPAAPAAAPAAAASSSANEPNKGPDLESVLGVGDRLHATVVYNGRRHDVRVGDTFAGFKVLALDADAITLRSSSGTTQRVTFSQALPPPQKPGMSSTFPGMPPLMPAAPQ